MELNDDSKDAMFLSDEIAVQIQSAAIAERDSVGINIVTFENVRARVAALNLVDSKGQPVTAARVYDSLIHQSCESNNIQVIF